MACTEEGSLAEWCCRSFSPGRHAIIMAGVRTPWDTAASAVRTADSGTPSQSSAPVPGRRRGDLGSEHMAITGTAAGTTDHNNSITRLLGGETHATGAPVK